MALLFCTACMTFLALFGTACTSFLDAFTIPQPVSPRLVNMRAAAAAPAARRRPGTGTARALLGLIAQPSPGCTAESTASNPHSRRANRRKGVQHPLAPGLHVSRDLP